MSETAEGSVVNCGTETAEEVVDWCSKEAHWGQVAGGVKVGGDKVCENEANGDCGK